MLLKVNKAFFLGLNTKNVTSCGHNLGCSNGIESLGLQLLRDVRHRVGDNHGAPVKGVLHSLWTDNNLTG